MASKRIKKRTRTRVRLQGTRYWMAVGTLAAYSAGGMGKPALAQGKSSGITAGAGTAEQIQSLPVRRYDVAGGTLRDVIDAFQKTAEVHVEVANPGILDVASPGVSGVYTVDEALKKLLLNTGVSYSFTGKGTVKLEVNRQSSTVDVTAEAPIVSSSLPKYQASLQDIAQTVDVVPQQVMQEQNSTTLRDALRNVAGISLAAGEGGSQGDNLTIRGFTARNDLYIDGMRDFGSYYRDPFNTQEVEVIQGPSSTTFGRGSTGGVVNQASKTPNLNQFVAVGLDFGTDLTRRATIDVNVPLPQLGTGAAFRMNAMGDLGDVAGRNVAENRRDGFAPQLALGLGTPTRYFFNYFHQNEDDIPDYGVPWLFNQAAPVNRNNYYGLANGNYLRTYDDIGTVRVEHDVNGKVTIRDQVRYANYIRDVLITEPQLTGYTLSTPLDAMQVTRHEIGVNSTETMLDEQFDLTAHFETGFIKHTLIAGVEGIRETSDPTRPSFTAPTTSLLNPNPYQSLNAAAPISTAANDDALTGGGYLIDTVDLGKKWELTGGVRYDRFDDHFTQATYAANGITVSSFANLHRDDNEPTWRAAVVYHPIPIGTLYFDAGTSFNPSAESLSLSAATAGIAPEMNRTYEFGTKWSFAHDRLSVNSAWFRTTKYNAREPDPDNPTLDVLAGTERVGGVEVDVRGRIMSRWDILSGYAYLDSRVVGSNAYPAAVGYPLSNVPKNTFNFWSNYHLPAHFEFGVGTNYESSRTASATAPLDPVTGELKEVPGYWVFSAMASHPIGEHIDLQVNAYNLANRYYYDELHPGHIVLGPGRSALVGIRFKF